MVKLDELVNHLDKYLDVDSIKDHAPKGLQVQGIAEIKRVVTGVSACMELFRKADQLGAQAVIVHHGMFWDSDPKVLKGSLKQRVKFLLEHDISLLAYHLPLDLHPEVGNNIQIVNQLGLRDQEPFGEYNGRPIGWMARTSEPVSISAFVRMVSDKINPDYKHYPFGPELINMVAICSGGAPELLREAVARRADLFLTGEQSEWGYHLAREEKLHYIAAGHHATERFGPMALGKYIAGKFEVEVEFVDIPNPA